MISSATRKEGIRLTYPWMFGRQYDLLFFFLPCLLGITLFSLARFSPLGGSAIWSILLLEAFGAGAFHWGPTWFAYFDKQNRDYWKSQPVKSAVFFVAPILIIPICILGSIFIPWLIALVTMLWALQHLIQQNVGILLLYHDKNGGEAIVDRTTEARSQQCAGIFFASIFYWRYFFGCPSFWLYGCIGAVLFSFAAYYVCKYIFELSKQISNGAALNVPALGFWTLSVLAFLPYAFFGKAPEDSFLIPVTMHWFQYIGLNYWLVRKKYDESPESANRGNLPNVSPILLFLATCSFGVLSLIVIKSVILTHTGNSLLIQIMGGIYMGIANIHYLLDGFLWKFREEHARKTILPFLLVYRKQNQAA